VAQKRSIKASNLTHTKATTLQRKLKYYKTTLRASNATQSFIDKVIERASDVATCDQFEVPMVFGFKNHTVAVRHGPEKGQFLPDVICSVIHALNHEFNNREKNHTNNNRRGNRRSKLHGHVF
jgi:hypothetical protein